MGEPPSPTLAAGGRYGGRVSGSVVVGADEQADIAVDVDRWCRLAQSVLDDEGRAGELTLTFVDRTEIAALNAEHLGHHGPTDVLSFPLDDGPDDRNDDGVPILLGDVVVCPAVAAEQASAHAGTLDDELALLVVHGVLHVLGHDHATDDERRVMQDRELVLLERHHWDGPAPSSFRQEHSAHPPARVHQ
ncbi:MAG: rRNA maturation RNase YbeY [Ilumatobacteraceae bacterium]